MSDVIRVVLAKPGLDGHNRGIRAVAKALSSAGMEVVYLGLRKRPRDIARAVQEEDPHVLGLSILSGSHMTLVPETMKALQELGIRDVAIVVGGVIPDDDAEQLRAMGVAAVFTPNTLLSEVVEGVRSAARGVVRT